MLWRAFLTSARSPPLRLPRPPSLHSALKDTLGVLFSDIDCLGHDGHTSRGEADSALMPVGALAGARWAPSTLLALSPGFSWPAAPPDCTCFSLAVGSKQLSPQDWYGSLQPEIRTHCPAGPLHPLVSSLLCKVQTRQLL